MAAYHCIEESGRPVEDLYGAVISAVGTTYGRHLYLNKDAGLSDDDFLPMMFFDACFLVHCMVWYTDRSGKMDVSLSKFFEHNYNGIRHDMMLLDNQLPWGCGRGRLKLEGRALRLEEIHCSLERLSAGPQACYGRSACC